MLLKYLWYVIRHKWYVFVECCRMGIPWLGIVHDLSKLLPSEFMSYARHFYGRLTKEETKPDFDVAWLHHQKRNKHHWQYWILQYDEGEKYDYNIDDGSLSIACDGNIIMFVCEGSVESVRSIVDGLNCNPACLPMPDRYRREMLADWIGAGKAIMGNGADTAKWYRGHRETIMLHPETRDWIDEQLGL